VEIVFNINMTVRRSLSTVLTLLSTLTRVGNEPGVLQSRTVSTAIKDPFIWAMGSRNSA